MLDTSKESKKLEDLDSATVDLGIHGILRHWQRHHTGFNFLIKQFLSHVFATNKSLVTGAFSLEFGHVDRPRGVISR